MQYYNIKLRLDGNTMNEVRKEVSAPEILILQFIHGVDSISEVEKTRIVDMNLRKYKAELKGKYDQALVKRETSVDAIFGPLGQVPTVLPDDFNEQFDIVDEDDILSVAKSVTKQDKNNLITNQAEADRMDAVIPASQVDLNELAE